MASLFPISPSLPHLISVWRDDADLPGLDVAAAEEVLDGVKDGVALSLIAGGVAAAADLDAVDMGVLERHSLDLEALPVAEAAHLVGAGRADQAVVEEHGGHVDDMGMASVVE